MQPTITIPKDWEYPRFTLGERHSNSKLKKVILHFEFCILNCFGQGWRYTVLPNKNSSEVRHYFDDQI
jgi:hypothetical protein